MKKFLENDFLNRKKNMKKTHHIEYIVHVYVEAEDEDKALERGSYHLHMLQSSGTLNDHCEFLHIEVEEDEDE